MCESELAHLSTCRGQRRLSVSSSVAGHLFPLRQSLHLKLTIVTRLVVSGALGSTCFCLPVLRSQIHTAPGQVFCGWRYELRSSCMHSKGSYCVTSQPLFLSYFKFTFIYLWGGAHMPGHTSAGQRTVCRNQLSPSIQRVPRMELRLGGRRLYPLNHLTSSCLLFF